MKKLLLILLCLPIIGFAQFQYQLDSIVLTITNNPYTVIFSYDMHGNNVFSEQILDNVSDITDTSGNIIYSHTGTTNSISYNSQNKPISYILSSRNAANQSLDTNNTHNLTYNSNDLLIEIEVTHSSFNQNIDLATGNSRPNFKKTYSYNSNNEVILEELYHWNGSTYDLVSRIDMYWQSGKKDYDVFLSWNSTSSNWDSTGIIYYTHNSGNLTSQQDQSGTIFLEYTYNNLLYSETAFPSTPHNEWSLIGCPAYYNQLDELKAYSSTGNVAWIATCHYSPFQGTTSIKEQSKNKELLKITDLLGRGTKEKNNQPLFYIYDDGSVEKRVIVE